MDARTRQMQEKRKIIMNKAGDNPDLRVVSRR
jgi:hypothetical protein